MLLAGSGWKVAADGKKIVFLKAERVGFAM